MTTHRTMSECSYHGAISRSPTRRKEGNVLFNYTLNTFFIYSYRTLKGKFHVLKPILKVKMIILLNDKVQACSPGHTSQLSGMTVYDSELIFLC